MTPNRRRCEGCNSDRQTHAVWVDDPTRHGGGYLVCLCEECRKNLADYKRKRIVNGDKDV